MTAAEDTLVVHVNDAARALSCGTGLLTLLEEMALAGRQDLAVAVNGVVVPRGCWADRELQAGDRVLLIQASQGG
jgi:sulfur carrier protein